MTKNFNVSMSDELFYELEQVRKSYGMNRSSFIQLSIKQTINNDRVINSLPDLLKIKDILNDLNNNIGDLSGIKK